MNCKNCIHSEVCHMWEVCDNIERLGCLDFIARADVQKIKHGEWIKNGYCDIPCVCSCCGAEAQYTSTFKEILEYDCEKNLCSTGCEETRKYIRTPFCSNCGAKMDGGKNDDSKKSVRASE